MLRYQHRATDRVTVILKEPFYNEEKQFSEYRETDRIDITARITTVTAEEASLLGGAGVDDPLTVKRLRCHGFPGDEHSQVIDGSGVLFDVIGEPKRANQMTVRPNDSVLLQRIG